MSGFTNILLDRESTLVTTFHTPFSGTGSFDCLMESQVAPRSTKRDNRIPLQDWKASVTLLMMFLFMDVDKQKERPRKIIMRIFTIFCCEYNKWDSSWTLPSGGSKLKRRFSWDSSSVQKGLAQFHPCSKQSSATREYLQETSQHSTTGTASHAHKTPPMAISSELLERGTTSHSRYPV